MSEKGHQKHQNSPNHISSTHRDKQNQPNSQVVSKGRPPNIKTARNIQNRTPIRSQPRQNRQIASHEQKGASKASETGPNNTPSAQPMLQHDSGHMRTATTPLRNIRHAHARKHKYTLKRNTYHKHTNTTHHIPSMTRRTPPHTGEAMSPSSGGVRPDTTPRTPDEWRAPAPAHNPCRTIQERRHSRASPTKAQPATNTSSPITAAATAVISPWLRIASCLALSIRNWARARAACELTHYGVQVISVANRP